MRPRPVHVVFGCVALGMLAGCGGGSAPKPVASTTTTTTSAPTTTTAPSHGALTISPTSGRAGTAFTLKATQLQPGESITFEIDKPGGKVFRGPAHKADASGTVVAPYRSVGDAAGDYTVKFTGDRGSAAAGGFHLDASAAPVTTTTAHRGGAPAAPTTTARKGQTTTTAPKSGT